MSCSRSEFSGRWRSGPAAPCCPALPPSAPPAAGTRRWTADAHASGRRPPADRHRRRARRWPRPPGPGSPRRSLAGRPRCGRQPGANFVHRLVDHQGAMPITSLASPAAQPAKVPGGQEPTALMAGTKGREPGGDAARSVRATCPQNYAAATPGRKIEPLRSAGPALASDNRHDPLHPAADGKPAETAALIRGLAMQCRVRRPKRTNTRS